MCNSGSKYWVLTKKCVESWKRTKSMVFSSLWCISWLRKTCVAKNEHLIQSLEKPIDSYLD